MGRKKLKTKDLARHVVPVRLTDTERKKLVKLGKANGERFLTRTVRRLVQKAIGE